MTAIHTNVIAYYSTLHNYQSDNCWLELIMNRRIQIFLRFLGRQRFSYLRLRIPCFPQR